MEQFFDFLKPDEFFAARQTMVQNFPREMMLSEGILLGSLLGVTGLLLLFSIFRKKMTPLTAASMIGMTAIIEAAHFGRLAFIDSANMSLFFAFSIAAAIFFLTAIIRPARDNAFIGFFLLCGIIITLGFGVGEVTGLYEGGKWLPLILVSFLTFSTLLILQQGLSGDRRAMALIFSILMANGAFIAMILSSQIGISEWIGAILPHIMLSVAVISAGLISLIPASQSDNAPTSGLQRMEPVTAFTDEDEPLSPLTATKSLSVAKDTKNKKKRARQEPSLLTDIEQQDDVSNPSYDFGERPLSASAASPVPDEASQSPSTQDLRQLLGMPKADYWEWEDNKVIHADKSILDITNLPKNRLTPEFLRAQIEHADLTKYDDTILGGENPTAGRFDLNVHIINGQTLTLTGMRFLDDYGLVSRIVAFIVDKNEPVTTMAPSTKEITKKDIAAMKAALKNNEIKTWFQPIVTLPEEQIIGFEALARWHQPDGSIVPAEEFIPIVTAGGLELAVFEIVLKEATKELVDWLHSEPNLGQFVTVNISADGLIDNKLVKLVQNLVHTYKLPAGSLVLELTEQQVHANQSKALKVVKALHNLGLKIALDDLGAGHSNLDQLRKFKFDIVKTDKSLIAAIEHDNHAQILLGGVIDLARKLGMQVIAEGTETQGAAQFLKQMQCDMGQGYYFGDPAQADAEASQKPTEPQPPLEQLR
ncbi:MAG: EAL domain-containing protein [bacterium]